MLAFKPFNTIVPEVPPQVIGLVLVLEVITGVAFTVTVTQAEGEIQPATVCVAQ